MCGLMIYDISVLISCDPAGLGDVSALGHTLLPVYIHDEGVVEPCEPGHGEGGRPRYPILLED